MSNEIQQVPSNGNSQSTQREDFSGRELTHVAETSSSAVAAQARAQVESRFIMAIKRPRDWDDVRVRFLKECKRPSFAAVAIYNKPVGKGIEGPSIRFAETALRCMGNVLPEAATIYDDTQKRIVRVTVTDLEANVTYSKDVTIDKTVERSKPRDGQQVLGTRTNAAGARVYIVAATDDDLLNKEGALVSKAIRVSGLRLIPGDLIDEALWTIRQTLAKADAEDPDAARNKIIDGFATINVMPSDLKEYLGHDIGTASPAEMTRLRGVFAAIRDNEATWQSVLEHRTAKPADEKPAASVAPSAADKLKEKLAEKRTAPVAAKPADEKPADAKAPEQPAKPQRQPGEDDDEDTGPDPPVGALKADQDAQVKSAPGKPQAPAQGRLRTLK